MAREDFDRGAEILAMAEGDSVPALFVGRRILSFLTDDPDAAEDELRTFARSLGDGELAAHIDRVAARFEEGRNDWLAETVIDLRTRLFPQKESADR